MDFCVLKLIGKQSEKWNGLSRNYEHRNNLKKSCTNQIIGTFLNVLAAATNQQGCKWGKKSEMKIYSEWRVANINSIIILILFSCCCFRTWTDYRGRKLVELFWLGLLYTHRRELI